MMSEQLAHGPVKKDYKCHQTDDLTREVPQGSILNPVLSNSFKNDLDTGLEGILNKFTDESCNYGIIEWFGLEESLKILNSNLPVLGKHTFH
ncbi:hypothetical protein TURU_098482 [Turdus rufiventris]|nr:hypothetical protein TURU_098482 [Turdus rufiventris]